ncbi:hypothetical protein EOT10_29930 [Streptomyces antnestii]|uniref:Uncharacterized protein n=1 Tax=Streptomyces antnestii TaxID=2494256 RepID=A0A3S3UAA4_9ACTN|nr:hypothetical protein EOT10_29930 [Streptomyces sp. San01]
MSLEAPYASGRPRLGSIRRFHGPTDAGLRPVWAARSAAGTVDSCVSYPLSTRHFKRNHRRVGVSSRA